MKINLSNIKKAKNLLFNSECIAIPTETVYGLAGNAYSDKSVKKIYTLKKRPLYNPLIIHFYNLKKLNNDVVINKSFLKLYKAFCPGPITFILRKNPESKISHLATAKKNTVAIRFPKHKVERIFFIFRNFHP